MGAGRVAVLVERDMDYAAARLLSHNYATPEREVRVFRRPDEADAWLEGPSPGSPATSS